LDKFVPEGWTCHSNRPALVYQIWQDHAFFYAPRATNGVQCKQVRVPQRLREEELLQRHDDDDHDVVLYDAMVPYTEEALISALDAKEAKVFYVHGGDLSSTAERLNEWLRLTFTTSFEEVGSQPVPSRIRALFFKLARGRRIVIRKIPSNAPLLRDFCRHFEATVGIKLEYHAEALPTLALKAMAALLVKRRKQLPSAATDELAERQHRERPLWAEKLPEDLHKCEVDNIQRLDQGGADTLANIQLVHKACHRDKTQREILALPTGLPRLESQLNYNVRELFAETPFPTQVV